MSLAISSAVVATDISSAIDTSEVVPATTGRDNGAKTKPTIMKIASSRRMVIWQSTPQNPTDTTKLKALRVNDVVLNPHPIGKNRPARMAALGSHHAIMLVCTLPSQPREVCVGALVIACYAQQELAPGSPERTA
jgi:hypothetical protein